MRKKAKVNREVTAAVGLYTTDCDTSEWLVARLRDSSPYDIHSYVDVIPVGMACRPLAGFFQEGNR